MFVLIGIFLVVVLPLFLGNFFAVRQTNWTKRRVAAVAAAPVPLLVAGAVGFLAIFTWRETARDSVEFAFISAVPGLILSMFLCAVGFLIAAVSARFARRATETKDATLDDIFK